MSKVLITGSGNGLGRHLTHELRFHGHKIVEYDIADNALCDVRNPSTVWINAACEGELDVLINCAGINRIDWIENFSEASWDAVMDVNAKGIFKMTQACLPYLINSKGTVLNIVSNASHMPMTCSTAYNASKGAAHIMTLQMARELTRKYGITVFGISPNKLRGTNMSDDIDKQVCETRGWSPEKAQEYQLAGLLAGEETSPVLLAEFIAFLLQEKSRHKFLTGCVIPYGA